MAEVCYPRGWTSTHLTGSCRARPRSPPNIGDPLWIAISIKSCIAILGLSASVIPFPRHFDFLKGDCENYKKPSTLDGIGSRILKVFRLFRFTILLFCRFVSECLDTVQRSWGPSGLYVLMHELQLCRTVSLLYLKIFGSPPSTEPAINNPFVVSIKGVLRVPIFPLHGYSVDNSQASGPTYNVSSNQSSPCRVGHWSQLALGQTLDHNHW